MRAILSLIGASLLAAPAMAQQPQPGPQQACAPFNAMSARLKEQYHEQETSFGAINDTTAIVLFTAPEGKTWTIITVSTSGMACMVAVGTDWSQGDVQKGGTES